METTNAIRLVPVNQTAANVTVACAVELFKTNKRIEQTWSDVPLPTRPLTKGQDRRLIGKQFGRLTVVGLCVSRANKGESSLWSCRCACGAYVSRTTRAVNNTNNFDMCDVCRALEFSKHDENYRLHGGAYADAKRDGRLAEGRALRLQQELEWKRKWGID